jgi:PAS domain S-box-containing protein
MSRNSHRLLLVVEDNPGDARLLLEMFDEQGAHNTELTHVESMSEAEKHLAGGEVDIILLDLGLPDAHGLEAVRRAHAVAPRVPLVVLTGLDDEALAVQALQAGAQDYLIKGQIDARGLLRALRYAIERKISQETLLAEAEQLRMSEARVRESKQHLSRAQELAEIGSFEHDLRTRQVTWSDNLYAIFGVDRQSFPVSRVSELFDPADRARFLDSFRDHAAGIVTRPTEFRIIRPDGDCRTIIVESASSADEHGAAGILLGTVRDVTSAKAAEATRQQGDEALRRSARLLEAAQEVAELGSWVSDPTRAASLEWSPEVYRIFGLEERDFDHRIETFFEMVHPADLASVIEARRLTIEDGRAYRIDHRIVRPDGSIRWVHQRARVFRDAEGQPPQMIGIIQDITEKRLFEQQLAQSRKMEAIGNLTGGMAHDFNNLLGVIIGNLDLLRSRHAGRLLGDELVGEALDAATRGAELTRSLLAFARRQPLQAQRIALNEAVTGTTKLLLRVLGERVEVSLDLAPEVWPVVADPVQLEAALVNLATNARDAMPEGGKLTIATSNRRLDEDYVAHHSEVAPGDYVMTEVSDTGTGIAPELAARIFEPFVTTKGPGEGTGLGLAMVFGYMKQSGGHINVYSEPGIGTTFRLYLPRAKGPPERALPAARKLAARGRGETVLVVEDNAPLRRVALRQMVELGYAVKEAENASAAIELMETVPEISVLFSDVVMPGGIDGLELARISLRRWPSIRIVLTSGFPGTNIYGKLGTAVPAQLLTKPYHREDLAQALREALDS